MTAFNFAAALTFVWQPGFDSPRDGYHATAGDSGGGTKGGVIEATWAEAVKKGIVRGSLTNASDAQLTAVLRTMFWQPACEKLPSGLDLLLFNGSMMSGRFVYLMQSCLGFYGDDLDGWIGPQCLAKAASREPETLIDAITGVHFSYLSNLDGWKKFGGGWSKRLIAAQVAARELADAAPLA